MSDKFRKRERLKSRKVIQALFNREGESFAQYPLRLIWMPMANRKSTYPLQFGVSVPKRRFKKAAERNLLKRKIREAYRLQKQQFYAALEQEEEQYAFMLLYTGQAPATYQEIEKAVQLLLRRFLKKVRQRNRQTNR